MSEVLHSGGDRGATMIRLIEQFSDEEMTRLHEALEKCEYGGGSPHKLPCGIAENLTVLSGNGGKRIKVRP